MALAAGAEIPEAAALREVGENDETGAYPEPSLLRPLEAAADIPQKNPKGHLNHHS